jgi:hypothetical protein
VQNAIRTHRQWSMVEAPRSSFVSQCIYWIDLGCPARRNVASQKRNSPQQQRDNREGQWVAGLNPEEQT